MMRIEILAKFPKKKKRTREDLAYEETQKIIDPDYQTDPEEMYDFEYDVVSLDLNDIGDFLRWDDAHTQIIKRNNILYICKITYRQFKALYEELTGIKIKKFYYPDPIK